MRHVPQLPGVAVDDLRVAVQLGRIDRQAYRHDAGDDGQSDLACRERFEQHGEPTRVIVLSGDHAGGMMGPARPRMANRAWSAPDVFLTLTTPLWRKNGDASVPNCL